MSKPLYAYRVGEGSKKERVVISNKGLSERQFEMFYRHRWQGEVEIKVFKGHGLESYMVRRLRAIRLWVMTVWHVVLLRFRSKLSGIDFGKYLMSLVFPSIVLELIELLEIVQGVVRRCLRFSPFPNDRLVLFVLQNLIGSVSYYAKL